MNERRATPPVSTQCTFIQFDRRIYTQTGATVGVIECIVPLEVIGDALSIGQWLAHSNEGEAAPKI